MAHVARAVLDTNVLLSGVAFSASIPGKILWAWRQGALDVVLSAFILDEFRRVLPRLQTRHGMTEAEMDDLTTILSIQATVVEPHPATDPDLRDAQDQPVLGTLLAVTMDDPSAYLITGDKDLLALSVKYPIVTPAAFWARHG